MTDTTDNATQIERADLNDYCFLRTVIPEIQDSDIVLPDLIDALTPIKKGFRIPKGEIATAAPYHGVLIYGPARTLRALFALSVYLPKCNEEDLRAYTLRVYSVWASFRAEVEDGVIDTSREKTTWEAVKPEALAMLIQTVSGYAWLASPHGVLSSSSDVLAFAEQMLEASCPKWLMGWRRNARSTDERTWITGVMPFSGVGDSIFVVAPNLATDRRLGGAIAESW